MVKPRIGAVGFGSSELDGRATGNPDGLAERDPRQAGVDLEPAMRKVAMHVPQLTVQRVTPALRIPLN